MSRRNGSARGTRFYRSFAGVTVGFDRRRKDNVWEIGMPTKQINGNGGPWIYRSTDTVRRDAALKRAPKLVAEMLLEIGRQHVEWGQQLIDRGSGFAEQAEAVAKATEPDHEDE